MKPLSGSPLFKRRQLEPVVVELRGGLTTSITDDDWEVRQPGYIDQWQAASEIFSVRRFFFDQSEIKLQVDWSQAVERVEKHYCATAAIYAAKSDEERGRALAMYSDALVKVPFAIEVRNGSELTSRHFYESVVEYFLYDFFLIMNLAHPSSCDLHTAKISGDENDVYSPRLSAYFFESVLLFHADHRWGKVGRLSLDAVHGWFARVRSEFRMTPSNQIEGALLSILNICRLGVTVESVIWIFYALESLFDTKPGENFSALFRRICLLIGPGTEEAKDIKKRLRDLYDIRSAFVHGGFPILHPMQSEVFDRNVDSSYERLMSATDFGFYLLVACLQELVRRDWAALKFDEVLVGHGSRTTAPPFPG